MKNRKTASKYMIFAASLAIVLTAWLAANAALSASHAYSWLICTASRPKNAEFSTVRLKWKLYNKKAAYYKLWYRCGSQKKKMKTFSGKKTGYTLKKLKKDSLYRFSLKAYSKKGKVLASRLTWYRTGIAKPLFDFEYADPAMHDSIPMDILINGIPRGYKYNCINLYRKAPSEDWKKIAKISATKPFEYYHYIDTDVTPFKMYQYRMRGYAYATINGKNRLLKSPYSGVESIQAIDEKGSFTWTYGEDTPYQDNMSEINIDCVLGEYNRDTVFNFDKKEGSEAKVFSTKDAGYNNDVYDWVGENIGTVRITEYNLDGAGWQPAKGKVTVKRGQKLGLKMIREGEPVDMTYSTVISLSVGYGRRAYTEFNIYMNNTDPKGTICFLNAYHGYIDCGD